MLNPFTFADLFGYAETFSDVLLFLQDFFFTPRSFEFFALGPGFSSVLDSIGLSVEFTNASLVFYLIGFGLPALLAFKLVKFLLDIVL